LTVYGRETAVEHEFFFFSFPLLSACSTTCL
jgi:hypothetical protein